VSQPSCRWPEPYSRLCSRTLPHVKILTLDFYLDSFDQPLQPKDNQLPGQLASCEAVAVLNIKLLDLDPRVVEAVLRGLPNLKELYVTASSCQDENLREIIRG
jgi:hypothetical protein